MLDAQTHPIYDLSPAATELLEKLKVIDHTVCRGGVDPENMVPVRELSPDDLAWTHFTDTPAYQGVFTLPYLNEDGTPVGGFGFAYCRVMVYNDGTAIALDRCWKYDRMALDGKPNKENQPTPISNHMTVKFYLIGCKHEYREMGREEAAEHGITGLFRTEHAHICDECGHTYTVDSSD